MWIWLACTAPHEHHDPVVEPTESVVDESPPDSPAPWMPAGPGVEHAVVAVDSPPDSPVDSPVDTDVCRIRVYAVRHAEKESEGDDPGLTEEGLARAQDLVGRLEEAPLVAVYASEKLRTQLTVQPTADDHGLTVQTELDPEDELAEHVLDTHCGEAILHGGHSYTLEDFFEALGGTDVPDVSGYGQLWILDVTDGVVTWEMSTFGDD